MRDLTGEPAEAVAAERAKVATEGWGRGCSPSRAGTADGAGMRFPLPRPRTGGKASPTSPPEGCSSTCIASPSTTSAASSTSTPPPSPPGRRASRIPMTSGPGRYRRALVWLEDAVGTLKPELTSTTWTLLLLRDMGLDPASSQARRAVAPVRDDVKWEHDGQDYFDGEVEPCINGRAVALGAYFGRRSTASWSGCSASSSTTAAGTARRSGARPGPRSTPRSRFSRASGVRAGQRGSPGGDRVPSPG